ncbi:Phage integrase, N-terminal SAM-like domain [Psychrobacillus psychrotolerans]|uniref:Phage integrase, N-terminal SAM-like domain n=1 Tax=Psychrobacillus psychrotolerans TaxID=126156 RepID=A0A1I6B7D2_9BACI|nr:site-specific integrase [Psychrobacillus psychrotolerans]SFQ76809.1 Phage integrase, N-terminal SAM-like domain [Psychrobacillus psychrotolerans]
MTRRSNSLSTKELSMIKLKITDEEAFRKFERDCLIRNLRTETLRYYKDKFAATKNTLKEMKIDKQLVELTQKDIEDIVLHLKSKIKVVSINTRIRALKSFYNFLYKNKLVMPNPMKNIKQLRDRTRVIETLEDKELELLAAHIKNQKSFIGVRDYVIFLVMLDTGIRLSE